MLLAPAVAYEDRARSVEQDIFEAINQQREQHRLPRLRWNSRVAEQARAHSRHMLEKQFFSHDDPKLGGPANRLSTAGIAWRACGENLFQEMGAQDPVAEAVKGWMRSPGHRRNILTAPFTDTGVGVALGRDGTYMITQIFAAF